ncbi:hypothetical protein NM688_g2461 [Phlebia brevispora]|uniref:Uncharacterized protein n=1 Tax=Phlebia brevispora TaxID=194682 RepID=A0ACC1T8P0_9APHY|nr:hypothetical protein NM688_g2461 [Phlebia brevispora]
MSQGINEVLRTHHEKISALYTQHLEEVHELQRTLTLEILPGLVDEFQLDDDSQEYCLDFLEDAGTIFRTLRRHKFISSFALQALRETLVWRLRILRPVVTAPLSPFLHCLPTTVHDPFGRPIVVLNVASICSAPSDIKSSFIHNMELLRMHLVHLNELQFAVSRPILQYVALLDIRGISFNNAQQNIELFNWFVRELLPRFPGMLGAVFVLNYSWAHAGIWNLAKRLLPVTALERVFFPSEAELQDYFSSQALPRDLGGDLPPLSTLENPLHRYVVSSLTPPTLQNRLPDLIPDREDTPITPVPRPKTLSATSLSNPFYGYPVEFNRSSMVPTLRHGRRRKRDLVRTLLRLWWSRWRHHIKALLYILALLLAFLLARKRVWQRRGRLDVPRLQALLTVPVPFS